MNFNNDKRIRRWNFEAGEPSPADGATMQKLNRESWGATDAQWNDWHWQLANSGRAWTKMIDCRLADGLEEVNRVYPMQATPYYLSLCGSADPGDPLLRQCLPDIAELEDGVVGEADPFDELGHCHVPRLVHRYRDRCLFVTTGDCAAHCRHCMRKRNWGEYPGVPSDEILEGAVAYVSAHPEVREILVSGGDALTLGERALHRVMSAFAAIPTVEVLRLGSRTPAVMPQRLTSELGAMLDSLGKPVYLAAHFNHPRELTAEAAEGVERMIRFGVVVINQAVLLKGVNDAAETLRELFTGLLKIKVKPYYLFHGDPIKGTTHFRTGVERGLELMRQLRGHVSGLAMPAFSFDLPEGGGKIRLEPDSALEHDGDGNLVFRSFEGRTIVYR